MLGPLESPSPVTLVFRYISAVTECIHVTHMKICISLRPSIVFMGWNVKLGSFGTHAYTLAWPLYKSYGAKKKKKKRLGSSGVTGVERPFSPKMI